MRIRLIRYSWWAFAVAAPFLIALMVSMNFGLTVTNNVPNAIEERPIESALSESIVFSGFAQADGIHLSNCSLVIRTKYTRPCGATKMASHFVVQRIDEVDMRELSYRRGANTFGETAYGTDNLLWRFDDEADRRIDEIVERGDELFSSTPYDFAKPLARALAVSGQNIDLMQSLGVKSKESATYCSGETTVEPYHGIVSFGMLRGGTSNTVQKLLMDYGKKYCE